MRTQRGGSRIATQFEGGEGRSVSVTVTMERKWVVAITSHPDPLVTICGNVLVSCLTLVISLRPRIWI